MSRPTRGVRNNNPGNIDRGGDWQGLASAEEMTPEQRAEKRFAVFRSPEWGIRAMCRVLLTYQRKHGLNTVAKIINRWAPPKENNTVAYVRAVAKAIGVGVHQPIDVRRRSVMKPLVVAIIAHENAGWRYPDDAVERALDLAGIPEG